MQLKEIQQYIDFIIQSNQLHNIDHNAKIAIGMSGGVDSSVVAYLLKQANYQVIGVFMSNWEDDPHCTIKEDSIDAIACADILGIDIEIVDFAKEYRDEVFSDFLMNYQNGLTPNPDILCNSKIKFKHFMEYALSKLQVDYIATGHYVGKMLLNTVPNAQIDVLDRLDHDQEILTKALDNNKDQSYFLYALQQHQIKKAIFPLANIKKPVVRQIAQAINLPTADKKDSTGICFIGKRSFRDFLAKYIKNAARGDIIDIDRPSIVLGKHDGLAYYTIGQRQGIGIGGTFGNNTHLPWYVVQKDIKNNILLVTQNKHHKLLMRSRLSAGQLSFISNRFIPRINCSYQAKIRYRMPDADCTIHTLSMENDHMIIDFQVPQWAITPGQSIVIYDKNLCLGGGIIKDDQTL